MIMKKKVFIFIVVVMSALPVFAQVAKREVLFTMGPNEEIEMSEYLFRLKDNGVNFVCILNDTVSGEQSLIWNGERKVIDGDIYYVDMEDFNRSVYTYIGKDGEYIFANGHNYGPYKNVNTCMYNYEPVTGGRFVFSYEGSDRYVHDYDGKIYPLKDGRHEYKSLNKQHTLKVNYKYTTYILDGYEFTLPLPEGFVVKIYESFPMDIFVFNNGNCFIDIAGKAQDRWYSVRFFIKGHYVKELAEQELVDFEAGELAGYEKDPFINNPNRLFHEGDFDWVEDEEGEYHVAYEFVMNDRSDRHSFFANWKHDYVIIDGKHYGRSCPIDAKYDEENNRFIWFSIEGREIVRYTFQM